MVGSPFLRGVGGRRHGRGLHCRRCLVCVAAPSACIAVMAGALVLSSERPMLRLQQLLRHPQSWLESVRVPASLEQELVDFAASARVNTTGARGWRRQRRHASKDSCRVVSGAHSVLYVTYSASNLQVSSSATSRKLRQIVADFAGAERRPHEQAPFPSRKTPLRFGQPFPTYRLELLYQRTYAHEPFNCSLHVPIGASCGEFTREAMKQAFGHDMALHRPPNVPRRLNVGFWVMALWMMQRERAARCDRGAFVWYLEDDVYLPGSWSRFLGRYDTAPDAGGVDLLVAQPPYQLQATDLAVVRGTAKNPQLSIPRPTLARRLPVTNEDLYAKAPLYTWRMRDRLANAVAEALRRGVRAHEEFLVPTVCRVQLQDPPCHWQGMAPDDLGTPCGANWQDVWNRAQTLGEVGGRNWTAFHGWMARLQAPGASKLLAKTPQRMHHPVKGQITVNWDMVRKRMGRTGAKR